MMVVRDCDEEPLASTVTGVGEPIKTANALLKRAEQLKRWEESETNKEVVSPNFLPTKVKFPEQCVFLAACASGDIDEVQTLLCKGADVNTANVDGLTALHQAVIDENLEMVQFLIANGADVNAQDNEGWTPLMAGVSCNFTDIVRYLLVKNADPVLHNNDGEMPLDLAETDEMRQILENEVRDRGIDIEDARYREERMMLEDAIAWSQSKRITKEPRHPATGATPVHVAAAKGYCKVLRIWLEAGADVDAKDKDGWTPLHAAAHWGEREACEILAEHRANFDDINNAGMTCIDVADQDIVDYLDSLRDKQQKMPAQKHILQKRPVATVTNNNISDQCATVPPAPQPSASPSVHLPSWRLTGRRATGQLVSTVGQQQPVQNVLVPSAPVFRPVSSLAPLQSPPPIDPKSSNNHHSQTSEKVTGSALLPPSSTHGDEVARKKPENNAGSPSTSFGDDNKSRGNNSGSGGNGQRGEESEAERKLRARRERESRRSTQGVTLETVKAAEHFFKKAAAPETSTPLRDESSNNVNRKNEDITQKVKTESNVMDTSKNNAAYSKQVDESSTAPTKLSTTSTSVVSSRLNANLTNAIKDLDEFQTVNGPFNKVARKQLNHPSKDSGSSSANISAPTSDRNKFEAKFIPGSSNNCTKETPVVVSSVAKQQQQQNLHVKIQSANQASVKLNIPNNCAASISSESQQQQYPAANNTSSNNSRVARRVRTGRRSTGPIAQDDVQLALGEHNDHDAVPTGVSNTKDSESSDLTTKENKSSINNSNRLSAHRISALGDDAKSSTDVKNVTADTKSPDGSTTKPLNNSNSANISGSTNSSVNIDYGARRNANYKFADSFDNNTSGRPKNERPVRNVANHASSKTAHGYQNLSDYRTNRSPTYLANVTNNIAENNHNGDRYISRTSSGVSVSSSSGGQDADVDYKKLYEKEALENDRLRKLISELEKSLENVKFNVKQASGDGSHIVSYNSRLEKLVAELEEENRTLEQIRADNIRLKEENGALIRVISKLSKSK